VLLNNEVDITFSHISTNVSAEMVKECQTFTSLEKNNCLCLL